MKGRFLPADAVTIYNFKITGATALLAGSTYTWTGGDGPTPGILLVTGLGATRGWFHWLAHRLCSLGFSVFTFDLPGHGESPGALGGGVLDDLRAVARYALGHPAVAGGLILGGQCLGGRMAIHLAPELPQVGAVFGASVTPEHWLIRAPVWRAMVDTMYDPRLGPSPRLDLDGYRALVAASDVRRAASRLLTPFLLVHYAGDKFCPESMAWRVFDPVPGPKRFALIAGGYHSATYRDPQVAWLLFEWLRDLRRAGQIPASGRSIAGEAGRARVRPARGGADAPSRPPEDAQEVVGRREVPFCTRDGESWGTLYVPEDGIAAHAGILVCAAPGVDRERLDWLSRLLATVGYAVFAVDFCGRGDGQASAGGGVAGGAAHGLKADLEAALGFFRSLPAVEGAEVLVVGLGLGGRLAWELSQRDRSVKGVFHVGGPPPAIHPRADARRTLPRMYVGYAPDAVGSRPKIVSLAGEDATRVCGDLRLGPALLDWLCDLRQKGLSKVPWIPPKVSEQASSRPRRDVPPHAGGSVGT